MKNNNQKNISKDWIFDLYEIFPNAIFEYNGFVLLDNFIENLKPIFYDNTKENSSLNGITNFQQLIIKKILYLLPKIRNFLSEVYKNDFDFPADVSISRDKFSREKKEEFDNFEKRFINKNIVEFKWFLELYFYPYKLFEKLINKSNLKRNDVELIMALDKSDFCADLLKLILSKKLNLKGKKIVLCSVSDTDDKDNLDKLLVNMIENERKDNPIPNEIREKIIEEIVIGDYSDRDFFVRLSNSNKRNKRIVFMVVSKLHQIDNNKEYLFNTLKESDVDNTIIIMKLLFNIDLELKDLKKIFKYVFDNRKNNENEYIVSKEASSLFSLYFVKNSNFLEAFKPIFEKYLKKSNDIKDEIFSHFVTLLNISLKESDTEKLISNVLNSIEDKNIKESVMKKIVSHFIYCSINSNDSRVSEFSVG